MATETTSTPTVEGVLSQLMREAEWLAGDAFDMSESAEPGDDDDPAEEPETLTVAFKAMDDVRYKSRRVLNLLKGIRKAFPEQTKTASQWCALCGIHTDHDKSEHPAAVPVS